MYVAKNGSWVQLKSSTVENSYTAYNLSPGTNYPFAVRAYVKENGQIVWSDSYKQVTIKTLPGASTNMTYKFDGDTKVCLYWSKVKSASSYTLYYRQNGQWFVLKKGITNNAIRVSGLQSGKKYTFAVQAYTKEKGKTVMSDVMTSKTVKVKKK